MRRESKYQRIQRKYEDKYYPRINSSLRAKVNQVITALKSGGFSTAFQVLSLDAGNARLSQELTRLYTEIGLRHANDEYRKLRSFVKKAGFGLNEIWLQFILEYLNQHLLQKATFGVNETLRDNLLIVLQKSVEEGLGVDETVRLLEETDLTETQAARIVRTEVNTAANVGFIASGQSYEYMTLKEWVSIHDNRTRGRNPEDHASHIGLDGVVIDFDDYFIDPRNGDRLLHPGDPKASASSIINCRCRIVIKPKRNKGRLIPKPKTTAVIFPNQIRQGRVITI